VSNETYRLLQFVVRFGDACGKGREKMVLLTSVMQTMALISNFYCCVIVYRPKLSEHIIPI